MELERELPLRVWLFRLAEDERSHVLLLVLHHIAGDGWSLGRWRVIWKRRMRHESGNRRAEWEPLPVQYSGLHAVAAGAAGERE